MAAVESAVTSLLPSIFLRREQVTPSPAPDAAAVRPALKTHDLLIFKARRLKKCIDDTALVQNKKQK